MDSDSKIAIFIQEFWGFIYVPNFEKELARKYEIVEYVLIIYLFISDYMHIYVKSTPLAFRIF